MDDHIANKEGRAVLKASVERAAFKGSADRAGFKASAGRSADLASTWNDAAVVVGEMAFQKPESGVWLAWDDLQVEVDVRAGLFKKERKRIIHGSRGRSRPGEVLAVMGPSGAGKSTLFSCLARRGNEMHVSGRLTLNGLSYDKADLAPISGFVFQDALMHTHVKTEET
jgi:ABC-type glutathione transport system ATPase component